MNGGTLASSLTGETALKDISSAVVKIDNGDILCVPGKDGASSVSWKVEKRLGVDAEDMEVKVETDGDLVKVTDEWHGSKFAQRPAVHIVVTLPADSNLNIALGNGDVETALNGELVASLGNGDIRLQGAPSRIDLELGNGDIQGSALLASGEHHVSVGNGDIRLSLLKGSNATVSATSATGDVRASGLTGKVERNGWIGGRYSGKVGSGEGKLVLTVGNGDLKLQGTDEDAERSKG
jgi:hypothetical protein